MTAAHHGLKVVLVEKAPVFGGATAWSGGWMWVPGNPLARRAGIHEDPQQPRTYLKNELGDRYDASRIDAFLDHCGPMVTFFEAHTALAVRGWQMPSRTSMATCPARARRGASGGGCPLRRACEAGPLIRRLRTTMRETSFMGMPIMAGADLAGLPRHDALVQVRWCMWRGALAGT